MSIEVVVCDDQMAFRRKIRDLLQSYFSQNGISYKLQIFSTADDVLKYVNSRAKVDIAFLDVDLVTANGIDLAKVLRANNHKFLLIFVSGLMEFATEGYAVKAFRYILKDQLDRLFAPCMDDALLELGINSRAMFFDFVGGGFNVYTHQIAYTVSSGHKLVFYLVDAPVTERHLYMKMDELEGILPKDEFLRPHKSYLVNYRYIEDIQGQEILLKNKTRLRMSNSYAKKARMEYLRYRGLIH